MPGLAGDIESRHRDLWTAATRHPFLEAVRDATISPAAFDVWLGQDYLFVGELLSFQARLLARAPRSAHAVLAGGLVAVAEELSWFERLGAGRGLELDQAPLETTRTYAALLKQLDAAPYATAITALWLLEVVYLQGWRHAAARTPSLGDYRDYVEHWTTPEFTGYVDALEHAAAEAGGDVDDDVLVEVLQQEIAFWDMAIDAAAR